MTRHNRGGWLVDVKVKPSQLHGDGCFLEQPGVKQGDILWDLHSCSTPSATPASGCQSPPLTGVADGVDEGQVEDEDQHKSASAYISKKRFVFDTQADFQAFLDEQRDPANRTFALWHSYHLPTGQGMFVPDPIHFVNDGGLDNAGAPLTTTGESGAATSGSTAEQVHGRGDDVSNVVFKDDRLSLTALRDIEPGEELLCGYATFYNDVDGEMMPQVRWIEDLCAADAAAHREDWVERLRRDEDAGELPLALEGEGKVAGELGEGEGKELGEKEAIGNKYNVLNEGREEEFQAESNFLKTVSS